MKKETVVRTPTSIEKIGAIADSYMTMEMDVARGAFKVGVTPGNIENGSFDRVFDRMLEYANIVCAEPNSARVRDDPNVG